MSDGEDKKAPAVTETSEAQIASHWKEEEYLQASRHVRHAGEHGRPGDRRAVRREELPEVLRGVRRAPHLVRALAHRPRHRATRRSGSGSSAARSMPRTTASTATWRSTGTRRRSSSSPSRRTRTRPRITYQELYARVNEFAALLRDFAGLKTGDRVTIHMPMVAELPDHHARLRPARRHPLGRLRRVQRRGVRPARRRLREPRPHLHGRLLPQRQDDRPQGERRDRRGDRREGRPEDRQGPGLEALPREVHVGHADGRGARLLRRRGPEGLPPAPASSRSRWTPRHPLFLMYTSGTTGKPKGCQHRTGGYLAYVAGTSKYIQDIHPEDVYWCMADIGWITGHSYIVYGPLAVGATAVIYEGTPTYPDAGRPWRIAERLDVNIFHTSPTAIRMLRKAGADEPAKYDYHFKHMTTVGEPIEPEVWRWYYEVVGKGEGGHRRHLVADGDRRASSARTKPALDPMKPGSAGPGMPGIYPVILDENGKEMSPGTGRAGNICIRNPWPGIMQTIWGDHDRFVRQYYAKYCKDKNSKRVAGLAVLRGRRRAARRRRLLPDPRPRRRRHQRGRAPARDQGARVGLPHGRRGRRGRGRPGRRRGQGARPRDLHLAQAGLRGDEGDHRQDRSRRSRR